MGRVELSGRRAPCKDCKERHPKCHGECEKYAAFCEESKRIRAARLAESELNAYQSESYWRVKRRLKNHDKM